MRRELAHARAQRDEDADEHAHGGKRVRLAVLGGVEPPAKLLAVGLEQLLLAQDLVHVADAALEHGNLRVERREVDLGALQLASHLDDGRVHALLQLPEAVPVGRAHGPPDEGKERSEKVDGRLHVVPRPLHLARHVHLGRLQVLDQARLVLLRLHNLGQAARHFLVLGALLVKLAQHLRQLAAQLDQAAVHVGHAGHVRHGVGLDGRGRAARENLRDPAHEHVHLAVDLLGARVEHLFRPVRGRLGLHDLLLERRVALKKTIDLALQVVNAERALLQLGLRLLGVGNRPPQLVDARVKLHRAVGLPRALLLGGHAARPLGIGSLLGLGARRLQPLHLALQERRVLGARAQLVHGRDVGREARHALAQLRLFLAQLLRRVRQLVDRRLQRVALRHQLLQRALLLLGVHLDSPTSGA